MSGAGTNYPIHLTVNSGSGTDNAGIVYLNNHANFFPYDVAFTDGDGTTALEYYRSPTDNTAFDVKVTDNLDSDQTIYIYYGRTTKLNPVPSETGGRWNRGNNPNLTRGTAGAWDDDWLETHSAVLDNGVLYMFYNACADMSAPQYRIGLATSTDYGATWTKDAGNPIVTVGAGGAWDDYSVLSPCVWKEGATWYMLYSGKQSGTGWSMGLATASAPAGPWTKSGSNPVMQGTAATWDSGFVSPGTRMYKDGSTYYLGYWGNTNMTMTGPKIGLATSDNLTTWTKSASNPIISNTIISDNFVGNPCLHKIGSTYYIWFYGGNDLLTQVYLATSATLDNSFVLKVGDGLARGYAKSPDVGWAESPIVIDLGVYGWRLFYFMFDETAGGGPGKHCDSGYAVYDLSDGRNTFSIFDDWTEGINPSVWTEIGDTTNISQTLGKLTLAVENADDNLQFGVKSVSSLAYPLMVETTGSVSVVVYGWPLAAGWDNAAWASGGFLLGHYKDVGNDYWALMKFPGGTSNTYNAPLAGFTNYTMRLAVESGSQKGYINGTERVSLAQTPPLASTIIHTSTNAGATPGYTAWFDYVIGKKYLTSGPVVGTPGSEETP